MRLFPCYCISVLLVLAAASMPAEVIDISFDSPRHPVRALMEQTALNGTIHKLSGGGDDGNGALICGRNNNGVRSFVGRFNFADGRAFTLLSLELAEYSSSAAGPISVTISGKHAGTGDLVRHVVQLDGLHDGAGGQNDFERFSLPPTFRDLLWLQLDSPDGLTLDHLRLDVPAALRTISVSIQGAGQVGLMVEGRRVYDDARDIVHHSWKDLDAVLMPLPPLASLPRSYLSPEVITDQNFRSSFSRSRLTVADVDGDGGDDLFYAHDAGISLSRWSSDRQDVVSDLGAGDLARTLPAAVFGPDAIIVANAEQHDRRRLLLGQLPAWSAVATDPGEFRDILVRSQGDRASVYAVGARGHSYLSRTVYRFPGIVETGPGSLSAFRLNFPERVVRADLGLGAPQLATTGPGSGRVWFFAADGANGQYGEQAIGLDRKCGDLAAGDLNQDGLDDIVMVYPGAGLAAAVIVGLNQGEHRFLPVKVAAFSDPREVVLGDLNNDGHLDIAVCSWGQGQVFSYYNQGDGLRWQHELVGNWNGCSDLVAGDFDADGRLDLATMSGDAGVNAVTVWWNSSFAN